MKRKICLGLCLVFSLAAFPVAIQAGPCSSKFKCKDCKDNGVGQYECKDVQYDSYCKCNTFPSPHIACELTDICDYTGPPACSNPSPSGECPGTNGFVSAPPTETTQAAETARVVAEKEEPSRAETGDETPDEE